MSSAFKSRAEFVLDKEVYTMEIGFGEVAKAEQIMGKKLLEAFSQGAPGITDVARFVQVATMSQKRRLKENRIYELLNSDPPGFLRMMEAIGNLLEQFYEPMVESDDPAEAQTETVANP